MDLAFFWPTSDGEWMAWSSAAVTVIFGLALLFAPGPALWLLRLQPTQTGTLAGARASIAGFPLGLGACALLLAQPLVYMALGFAWLFAAFGRLISLLTDGGSRIWNLVWLVVELALGLLPLTYALGFVA